METIKIAWNIIIKDRIYAFFLRNSILMFVFVGVGLIVHAFSLIPHDITSYEKLKVYQAQYTFIENSKEQKNDELLVLQAKIDAAVYARTKVKDANQLLINLTTLIIMIAILFLAIGLYMYYLHIKVKTKEIKASNNGEQ